MASYNDKVLVIFAKQPVAQVVGVREHDSAVHGHQLLWEQSFQGPLGIEYVRKLMHNHSSLGFKTCVPPGMKTGVSTTECGSVISATLARVVEHLASTRNAKADPSPAPMMASKSEQKDSCPI